MQQQAKGVTELVSSCCYNLAVGLYRHGVGAVIALTIAGTPEVVVSLPSPLKGCQGSHQGVRATEKL